MSMRANEVRKIRHIREEDAVSPVIATILMVAITVVLAGTLYVWAANLAESNTGDTLELYSFSSRDSAGSPSLATDDNLAIVTMSQGNPIGWASLSIRISVDGGASFDCALPGQDSGECVVLEAETTDGGLWSVGEDITIKENGIDMCNADICELKITITNSRSGNILGSTTTESEQGGDAVALPRSETVTVGPDGAVIQIQGAVVSIPQGALSVDTELTFEALTASDLFALGDEDIDGYSIPTTFLKLTPHGSSFSQPVTVTLRVTDSMPTTPIIYTKSDDNGDWEEFTGQLNIGANTITFELYSFSYYFGTSATADDVNRISYWWGKVNQHFENGAWATDPDGSSGANIDMLQYCQKWWPDTVSVQELPERESIIFYNAGNSGYFPTIKPVFECVSPDDGTGGGGSGGGGGDPNACSTDSDCLAGGYCLNGVCVYDDQDMDGISDNQDNCPANANANQADADDDGVGDACDNCPTNANADQANSDGDVYGDVCDAYPNTSAPLSCLRNYDPVCGIDGNNYSNACFAQLYNVQVDYNGQCGNCVPDCAGCECGDDGCGGSCGTCPNGETCNSNQLCVECQTAADCASGICANEVCVDCISDQDCPSGTLCDGNGECVIQANINEFHYDSPGADQNEGVEVKLRYAGGISTSQLSSVVVTLYNGQNGLSYATHSLDTFTEGVTDNGFTYYYKMITGIQNGGPDGISLSGVQTIQFLSYEGTFTAADGPANGIQSTDIGISESSSDGSLQYFDSLGWLSAAATWGDVNSYPADGTACDDGDPNTTGDAYTNGICQGTQSNSPPTLNSVIITPSTAYESTSLSCTASGVSDIDGDTVTLSYMWEVNSIQTSTSNTLNGASFNKDDMVSCTITPNDGTQDGAPVTSNSITIQNSLPVVSGLTFDSTSSGIFTHTTHNCLFSVSDVDGDAVTTIVRWYADGVLIGTGPTITLTSSLISVGQNLQCEVTPNDGTVDGQTVITPINANSVVQNSSPSISSVVIEYSTQQHSSGTFAGDQLTCTTMGTSDADGDGLTYAYTWYLNGASHSTGQNLDTTGMSSNDIVHCSAIANDGTDNSASVDSASTTVYTIHNIDIQNMAFSPSTITITAGDIIIWTNLDSMDHSVTSDDGTTFDSGLIGNSQTFTLTGLSIGTYGYHCTPHPSMTATIIVQ